MVLLLIFQIKIVKTFKKSKLSYLLCTYYINTFVICCQHRFSILLKTNVVDKTIDFIRRNFLTWNKITLEYKCEYRSKKLIFIYLRANTRFYICIKAFVFKNKMAAPVAIQKWQKTCSCIFILIFLFIIFLNMSYYSTNHTRWN